MNTKHSTVLFCTDCFYWPDAKTSHWPPTFERFCMCLCDDSSSDQRFFCLLCLSCQRCWLRWAVTWCRWRTRSWLWPSERREHAAPSSTAWKRWPGLSFTVTHRTFPWWEPLILSSGISKWLLWGIKVQAVCFGAVWEKEMNEISPCAFHTHRCPGTLWWRPT